MTAPQAIRIGPWTLDPASGELERGDARIRLAPKSALLLTILAAEPGRVVSREEISAALWPDVTVGEDSLARAISKLRKALGDDPKDPRYVETLPKRGYRLVTDAMIAAREQAPFIRAETKMRAAAIVIIVVVVGLFMLVSFYDPVKRGDGQNQPAANPLIARADDFYFQYTRADNEAAIVLYERIVEANPEDARALAGLANALVQRVMRWPTDPADERGDITTLGEAHKTGRLSQPAARRQIDRALGLAREAVRIAPREAASHKALGLALSANGEFEKALAQYEKALEADPDAWGVLINVGDVLEITGRRAEALPHFERAYAAMSKAYASQSAQVRPWQARLGAGIAERYLGVGDDASAEKWYREVLALAPLDRPATLGLARLLEAGGSTEEAARLCRDLAERAGGEPGC